MSTWLLATLLCLLGSLTVLGDSTSPECRALMSKCQGGSCPDLTIDASRAASSYYVVINDFTADSCAVIEGCTQPGRRKLLRFDLATPNVGSGDLYLGDPSPARMEPCFEWSPCHAHYHFTAYADYTLLNAEGEAVAVGAKASSCLMDGYRIEGSTQPVLPRGKLYTCQNQGIHKGYMDLYGGHLDCQWIDVTGVAPGRYTMRLEVNKYRVLPESNFENNLVEFPVLVPSDSDLPAPVDPESCPQWGGCSSCTNARGCGWCSSFAKCQYGDYTGPAGDQCDNWIWSAAQCSAQAPGEVDPDVICGAQTSCGRCAATQGCGWCGATNKCVPGLEGGPTPESGASCPNSWLFGSVAACPVDECLTKTDCSSCTNTAHCGWCTSTGKCNKGTSLGPRDAACGLWKWGSSQCDTSTPPPETGCLGLRLDEPAASFSDPNALRGAECPTGTNELPSGEVCSFSCRSGYDLRAETGIAMCDNTRWTVKQPVCDPDSCIVPRPPPGLNIGCRVGSRLESGNSFTYGVKTGWRVVSGNLTRRCFAGAYDHPPPEMEYYLDEQGQPMTTLAEPKEMHTASSNRMRMLSVEIDSSGSMDVDAAMMTTTGDKCSGAESCRDCTLRDGCGWDSNKAACVAGSWIGADAASGSAASRASDDWKWSHLQCGRGPPSAAAYCAQGNGACSACSGMRGCGYCASTGECTPGTWTGPKAGSCPTYVWDPSTCLSPLVTANSTLPSLSQLGDLVSSLLSNTPGDWLQRLSDMRLAFDPTPILRSHNVSLDDLLKVDPVGNHFKRTDFLSHAFKHDQHGNFLKHRRDVDLDALQQTLEGCKSRRPFFGGGDHAHMRARGGNSTSAESDMHMAATVESTFIDPYDFAPHDDRFPHGHTEHMHSHWGQSEEHGDMPMPLHHAHGMSAASGAGSSHHSAMKHVQRAIHTLTTPTSTVPITDDSCNGVDEPQPEPEPEPSSSSSTAEGGGSEESSSSGMNPGSGDSSSGSGMGGGDGDSSSSGGEQQSSTGDSSSAGSSGSSSSSGEGSSSGGSSSGGGSSTGDEDSSSSSSGGETGVPGDGDTGLIDDSAASATFAPSLAAILLLTFAALIAI